MEVMESEMANCPPVTQVARQTIEIHGQPKFALASALGGSVS